MYFLNINKPKYISSFDVIARLRKILKIKKIGHAGTLDPIATGVLQIGVGNCAKLLDYLDSDKEYVAELAFGYISETYDSEGDKTFIKTPNFSKDELMSVLNSFVGTTMQIPPKYSAIKIGGKKLCDIARKNKDLNIEIKPREIEIYSIELLDFDCAKTQIKVNCKKGTYIRSLIHDIGEKLGCGAYMTELTRTKAGKFKLENSNILEDAQLKKINPLDVLNFDKKELNDEEFFRIKNGNFISCSEKFSSDKILLTKNNKLVSIANLSDNLIKPKKFFQED